jgi:hypothetical protein
MEINVDIKNKTVQEVVEKLGEIPNAVRFVLHQSILYTLRRARTTAAKEVTARYNVPYGTVLKALGEPRMSGLVGTLHASGKRLPLSAFPTRDIFPEGTATLELRDAYPVHLLHAFVRGGMILERETKDTRRYPLRPVMGLALPIMIGQKKDVFPKIEAQMEKDLDSELGRLLRGVLSGSITAR